MDGRTPIDNMLAMLNDTIADKHRWDNERWHDEVRAGAVKEHREWQKIQNVVQAAKEIVKYNRVRYEETTEFDELMNNLRETVEAL